MITQNVLRRVLFLKFGDDAGTGFVLDRGGRQYLVTAKHVIEGFQEGYQLEIAYQGDWVSSRPTLIGHGAGEIDISVLSLEIPLFKGRNIVLETEENPKNDIRGFIYGQDVYFLGFPFGMYTDAGEINNHFPLPIIKKAIVSGTLKGVQGRVILLDGINNKGFSGGPVVFRNPVNHKSNLYVMSVISAYQRHGADVYYEKTLMPFKTLENTGIIISYDIKHALDIIDANPKGVSLE